jgi:hypothetical protein
MSATSGAAEDPSFCERSIEFGLQLERQSISKKRASIFSAPRESVGHAVERERGIPAAKDANTAVGRTLCAEARGE